MIRISHRPTVRAALSAATAISLIVAFSPPADATVTAFNFEGVLKDQSLYGNGTYDFRFYLYNALSGGSQLGSTVYVDDLPVTHGLFTTPIDFGQSVFDGPERYVEVAVRPGSVSDTNRDPSTYATLLPRQLITAVPYADTAYGLKLPFSGGTGNAAPGASITLTNSGGGYALFGVSTTWFGLRGQNGAGSGQAPLFGYGGGIWGDSDNGHGVMGTSGTAFGVAGLAGAASSVTPTAAAGVWGDSKSGLGVAGTSATTYGVDGTSPLTGVHGKSTGTDRGHYGVFGEGGIVGVEGQANAGYGVEGLSFGQGHSGTQTFPSTGVFGYSQDSTNGFAGYFAGNVTVTGTLTKPAGSFKIDHPLDPANKYLLHSFVESPDMKNIYDGVVTLDARGEATVTMPDWFQALNQDFRYQLTAIGAPGPDLYIAQEVQGNQFRIAGGRPGAKVSWQVTGIRHDAYANAHRIPVEEPKEGFERGRYLAPEAFGLPAEAGIPYALVQRAEGIPPVSPVPLSR